jgi:multidrug efflux pump
VALLRENVELPSGKVAGSATELIVRTFGRLNTEEEFNNINIKSEGGNNIKVQDIGEAVLGPENDETVLKESSIPMIALAIVPQPGSNYVSISDEFLQAIRSDQKEMPEDISLNIAWIKPNSSNVPSKK